MSRRKSPNAQAKQKQYRQTDAGRMARQSYLGRPEVKLRMKIRRAMRKRFGS